MIGQISHSSVFFPYSVTSIARHIYMTTRPLCVDLDGTLIASDILEESILLYGGRNPWRYMQVAFWLCKGRPYLKKKLGELIVLEPGRLAYHQDFLDFLKEEHRHGRTLYLVTASDEGPARLVADHVGIFEDVMASDGVTNLRALAKAHALTKRFGDKGFDYAGNSRDDLHVWRDAHAALAVETPDDVAHELLKFSPDARFFKENKTPTNWLDYFSLDPLLFSFLIFAPLAFVSLFFKAPTTVLAPFILGWICLLSLSWMADLGADLVRMRLDPLNPHERRRFLFTTGALDLPRAFKTMIIFFEAFILSAVFLPLSASLAILGVGCLDFWNKTRTPWENPHFEIACTLGLLAARILAGVLLCL